jgi:pyruvate-formate lyase-activating enzyme
MDSMRFSMNSVQEEQYNRYYRPINYLFADVIESVRIAKERGLFTMINYLVSPGLTDSVAEGDALMRFLGETGVDMLQMRNLSIDPDYYNREMRISSGGTGMYRLLERIKQEFPKVQFGYFNRTKENFFPAGYESRWPLLT